MQSCKLLQYIHFFCFYLLAVILILIYCFYEFFMVFCKTIHIKLLSFPDNLFHFQVELLFLKTGYPSGNFIEKRKSHNYSNSTLFGLDKLTINLFLPYPSFESVTSRNLFCNLVSKVPLIFKPYSLNVTLMVMYHFKI